jgi:two-component system CheB/CheR fusion protein
MKTPLSQPPDSAELRRQAEAKLQTAQTHGPWVASTQDNLRLIHELQVHQIELEMQNELLRQTRSEMEAALERYTDLYDFAPVGYLSVDEMGVINQVNLTAAAMLGMERRKLVGTRLGLFVVAAQRTVFNTFLQRVFLGQTRVQCAVTLQIPDRDVPLEAQIEAIPAHEGQECRIVITDITESKRVAEELQLAKDAAETANRAKDIFLAKLGHELRTPLTPVMLVVGMMEMDTRLPADVHDDLEIIKRNMALEIRLINDLLDLTRVMHGKLNLLLKSVDLGVILRQALEVCAADVATKHLHLILDLVARPCLVLGDADRLQQVFWNLIKNAVKFTPVGGKLMISSKLCNAEDSEAPVVVVEICDQGIGIEPELLPRLFDVFEQGGSTIHHHYGGLGLGLTISKSLVEAHGGTIYAASPGRDQGATFTVCLPMIATNLPCEHTGYPPK